METLSASAVPKHGVSRRAQNKRTMHARFPAALAAGPPAKRPCLKLPARRAATAPSKPAETECSDMSSHTTGDQTGQHRVVLAVSFEPSALSHIAQCASWPYGLLGHMDRWPHG